jgi:hypothetical protein
MTEALSQYTLAGTGKKYFIKIILSGQIFGLGTSRIWCKSPTNHSIVTQHKSKDICVSVAGTCPSAAVTVTCFSNTDIITQDEKTMGCCRLPACASTPQANLALCADRPDLPTLPPLCRQCCDGWHVSGYELAMQFAAECANRHSVTPFRQSREGKHPPYAH